MRTVASPGSRPQTPTKILDGFMNEEAVNRGDLELTQVASSVKPAYE